MSVASEAAVLFSSPITRRDRTCCGYSVARDCFVGFVILFSVAAAYVLFVLVLLETDDATRVVDQTSLSLVRVLISFAALCIEYCMVLLLFGDPGIVRGEHTPLGRAYYCRVCKAYMLDYDHHCGVVGSCIARHTMRYFIAFFQFVFFAMLLVLYVCVPVLYDVLKSFPAPQLIREKGLVQIIAGVMGLFRAAPVRILFLFYTVAAVELVVVSLFFSVFYLRKVYMGTYSITRRRSLEQRAGWGNLLLVYRGFFRPVFTTTAISKHNAALPEPERSEVILL